MSAGSLQSDIEDLEAKENMLDQLITNAGRMVHHKFLSISIAFKSFDSITRPQFC
jgi:hypothetical protein